MTTRNTRLRTVLSLTAFSLLITGALLYAGPLLPPSGPASSTYKTLSEVEPRRAINETNTPGDADSLFKITQPGSYYLTGNVFGTSGKHGIKIESFNVTIDLCGFTLFGMSSVGGLVDGIHCFNNTHSIKVTNGCIRGWGEDGLDLLNAHTCCIESVLSSENGGDGIKAGNSSTISNCSSKANGAFGFRCLDSCSLSNCTAHYNTGYGIFVDYGCVIADSTASHNLASGIHTRGNSTISNCVANVNSLHGISANFSSNVTLSSARSNGGAGISVNYYGLIADCTAQLNSQDGIRCINACDIRGNTCDNNGTGIAVSGLDNRIEGNNCTHGTRGIDITGWANVIVQNTCSGNNLNWNIAQGNSYGPIVETPPGASVLGNSAPESLGSTHPNANFTY